MEGSKDRPSLRERKKAKTRALIQRHAVRLFLEQGYDSTSIEQIAEVAEVSPSTVFRYFPTKPDLVLLDEFDPVLFGNFLKQPRTLGVVAALRATLRESFSAVVGEELELQSKRERLIRTVPELRAAALDELAQSIRNIARLVAERVGRSSDDPEIDALAGAVTGIAIASWFSGTEGEENWLMEMAKRMDAGLAFLESGFGL